MSLGVYISLEEVRKAGQIEQFCKEHSSMTKGQVSGLRPVNGNR